MFGAIFTVLAPLIAYVVSWIFDWLQVKNETKKTFYKWIAKWESKSGGIAKLHGTGADQLQAIRDEIAKEKEIK